MQPYIAGDTEQQAKHNLTRHRPDTSSFCLGSCKDLVIPVISIMQPILVVGSSIDSLVMQCSRQCDGGLPQQNT